LGSKGIAPRFLKPQTRCRL